MDIKRYLQEKKEMVDSALERYFLKEVEFPTTLCNAIRYSLCSGGKRIRPILSITAFETVGGKGDIIFPFACALEMIHTYSLIHDDLPAIDDDDYRRGKLTCHKAFGEGMAILAGDALLTEAFRLMAHSPLRNVSSVNGWMLLDMIHDVAQAAGILGMVGGQVVDIESEGKEVDLPTLQYIHTHKTGAMILVSIQIGVKLGGVSEETFKAFTRYGERIGLAFQIVDDILDMGGQGHLLDQQIGSDLKKKKVSYPSLLGLEESKRRARELGKLAVDALSSFGSEADPLREIAHFIIAREH